MHRCHGTNREHRSRTSKRARDVRTGESRDSTPLLKLKLLQDMCVYRKKRGGWVGKSYISLTPALLRPPPTCLRQFGPPCLIIRPLTHSAQSIAQPSFASFTTVLAARRRYMPELVRSPCSLLAALRLHILSILYPSSPGLIPKAGAPSPPSRGLWVKSCIMYGVGG